MRKLGFMEQVRQVLTGKPYILPISIPSGYDSVFSDVQDRDIQTISSDITCFPLVNADGVVECFAAAFIFKKYTGGKKKLNGADNTCRNALAGAV